MDLIRYKQVERDYKNTGGDSFIAINSLQSGPCSSKIARRPQQPLTKLHNVMEKYYTTDADFKTKSKAQRSQFEPLLEPS
jgi:hypothetical protein